MMGQFDPDGDEEMDLEGEEVVGMGTNGSMDTKTGEELGDSSSEGTAVPKTVVGEDGKTFLNPASLGRAPKPKPHPRYNPSLAHLLTLNLNIHPPFSSIPH